LIQHGIATSKEAGRSEVFMKRKISLHIGSYKTGSTSIQRFVLDHAEELREQGIALYRGQFSRENHLELYVASLRYERDSFAKLGVCKDLKFDTAFTKQVADRVHRFLRDCNEQHVLFTSEGLCLLRHEDEIERLKMIIDAAMADVTIILYLRNKPDFLRSYTNQLLKVDGRKPSQDYASSLYVEPDTWLIDYDSLVAAYRSGFGPNNVVVIDYDEEMKREGNVIPSFLRAVGARALHGDDVQSYFLNTTDKRATRRPKTRWSDRLLRASSKWLGRRAG
jgi:hypothetical protein